MNDIEQAVLDNEKRIAEQAKEYRFECKILNEDGEVESAASTWVSSISDDGSCESIEMELFSMLRAFRDKLKKEAL